MAGYVSLTSDDLELSLTSEDLSSDDWMIWNWIGPAMTVVKQTSLHSAHQRKTKMVQICVARCRSGLLCVCACMLLYWLTFLTQQVASLLSYDRDQLLLIKSTVDEALVTDYMGSSYCPPPVLTNVPDHLWHSPYDAVVGSLSNLERSWQQTFTSNLYVKLLRYARPLPLTCQLSSAVWRDRLNGSNQTFRIRREGSYPHDVRGEESTPIQLALTNTRSLVNKTFILHDFTTMNKMDYLFISETWLKVGDCLPISKLLRVTYALTLLARLVEGGINDYT